MQVVVDEVLDEGALFRVHVDHYASGKSTYLAEICWTGSR